MTDKTIHPLMLFCAAALFGLILAGCAATPQPTSTISRPVTTLTATVAPSATDLPQPTNSPTPDYTLTWAAYDLANPSSTPTGTPVMDATGNVTWHPQQELISFYELGGDGSSYYQQNFALYWDGTLMQPSNNKLGAPYISKLSHDEICKLLNTAQKSGFFGKDEPAYDSFPFSGAEIEAVSINGWESKQSGAQILSPAIAGHPYYDNWFCRNCPIPSKETIIRPALTNMYFLLSHYRPQSRQIAPVEKLHVTFTQPEKKATPQVWPLKSISMAQLWKDCNKDYDCTDSGMVVEGEIAREIMQKFKSGQVLSESIFSYYPYTGTRITYEAVWPDVPDVPADATLTCNVNTATYPLLPLNPQNQFWYYAPGGQWAAERVEPENRIRVVNTSGYEKFYQYDAQSFGQPAIQIYPRYWSADGQFFYVNILPKDYKPNVSLVNSIGLQKIDVKNEKVSYVFIGTQKESFSFSFSRDGKQIAYIRQGEQPLKLVVVDASSGEEKSAFISNPSMPTNKYVTVGSIVWSDNHDKFYLVATNEQDGKHKTDIFVVDPTDPAKMQIVYTADSELKLIDTGSYSSICPLITDDDPFCQPTLDLETGKIQK